LGGWCRSEVGGGTGWGAGAGWMIIRDAMIPF